MGIISRIKKEHRSLKQNNPKRNSYVLLFKRIWGGVVKIINAKVYLRRCKKGKGVTLRGKPRIDCLGEIVLGNNVKIWSHIHKTQISAGGMAKIDIGDNTFINSGAVISSRHGIKIGKNCQIATGVVLMDSDFHGVGGEEEKEEATPIIIEDNVWLATRVVVLKGVTVGEGSTVATGAVVTKDVPPYSLVAGVPAKVIKDLKPKEAKNESSIRKEVA